MAKPIFLPPGQGGTAPGQGGTAPGGSGGGRGGGDGGDGPVVLGGNRTHELREEWVRITRPVGSPSAISNPRAAAARAHAIFEDEVD